MNLHLENDALRHLETATAVAKACGAAGITDPAEIPALIDFARKAEEFNTALVVYQRAQLDWNRFVATHGSEDPGQDYYAEQLSQARAIYHVVLRVHGVALHTWRVARGLESAPALAA